MNRSNRKVNSHSYFGLTKSLSILPKSKRSNSIFCFIKKNTILSKPNISQSAIISTVLLILLVVVATMIIFSFVIPFITERLAKGDCINVISGIQIDNDPRYTCYVSGEGNVSVKVRVGDVRKLISGFKISLNSANDKSVTIKNGTPVTGITAFDGTEYITNLVLPGNNGAIVYRIEHSEKPESVDIYPILTEGQICDSAYGSVSINNC